MSQPDEKKTPSYSHWRVAWAIKYLPVSRSGKLLLHNLLSRVTLKKKNYACFPSLQLIARDMSSTEPTVLTAIEELEQGGWLTRTKAAYKSNYYTLRAAAIVEAATTVYVEDKERRRLEKLAGSPDDPFEEDEDVSEEGNDAAEGDIDDMSSFSQNDVDSVIARLRELFPQHKVFGERNYGNALTADIMACLEMAGDLAACLEELDEIVANGPTRQRLTTAYRLGRYLRGCFRKRRKRVTGGARSVQAPEPPDPTEIPEPSDDYPDDYQAPYVDPATDRVGMELDAFLNTPEKDEL